MNDTCARWSQAICERYYPAGSEGRPTYLALDDDELAELAPAVGVEPADAARSLANSVLFEKPALNLVWTPFLVARKKWRKDGAQGCPPYLAVLGLCVLAASRMASDEEAGVAANAYYPQLKGLLGEPPEPGKPEGFEMLKILWEDLAQWLEDDMKGERGTSTARTHPHFSYIGWPLSQCMLRAADRNRLPDFFRSARLEPGTEVSPERLFAMFQAWSRRRQALTTSAQRLVDKAGAPLQEELAEIVQRELAAWDGSLRDARGRRRGEILIRIEKLTGGRRVELSLAAPRPDGFPDGVFADDHGKKVQIEAGPEGWYADIPIKPTNNLLDRGALLFRDRWALSLEPSSVIPLRTSFEQGAWLEVHQATLLEEHMVLVRAELGDTVVRFLKQNAEQWWRRLSPKGNLPGGWVLFDRVKLKSAPPVVDSALERLVPRLFAATHLEGGLPLEPGIYLSGGEPDLWVDVSDERGAEIEFQGKTEKLEPGLQMIQLSRCGFPPDTHRVRAAGVARRFTSITTFGRVLPDGAGTYAHVVEHQKEYRPHAFYALSAEDADLGVARLLVSGACVKGNGDDLPAQEHPPVVVRRAWQSYVFLGARPGEVRAMDPPPEPRWLHAIPGKPGCQFFERALPFDAQLMVVRGKPEPGETEPVPRLRAVSERPSTALAGDSDLAGRTTWAEAVLGAAGSQLDIPPELTETWASYRQVALSIDLKEGEENGP